MFIIFINIEISLLINSTIFELLQHFCALFCTSVSSVNPVYVDITTLSISSKLDRIEGNALKDLLHADEMVGRAFCLNLTYWGYVDFQSVIKAILSYSVMKPMNLNLYTCKHFKAQ
jgi:hypothetical protein